VIYDLKAGIFRQQNGEKLPAKNNQYSEQYRIFRGLYCPPQIPTGILRNPVHSGHSGGMDFWQGCLPQ